MRYFITLLLCLPCVAQLLPVDTAVVVTVGPLIDDTDFKSLETAIAYNATGMSVDLLESSGTASIKTDLTLTTGGAQDWTHLGNGVYEVEITAAQNDTEGNLQVVGVADGVLPFFSPVYTVVPAVVYNSLSLGSDNLQVDTVQVEGLDATNSINAEADTALTDYDPPTKTELDSGFAALNDVSTLEVNTEVDTAMADYDAPTKAELDARTLLAASYFDPAADTVADVTTVGALSGHTPQTADHTMNISSILTDTTEIGVAGAGLTEAGGTGDQLSAVAWNAAWDVEVQSEATDALNTYDPPTKTELDSGLAALNDLSAAAVNTEVDTALADIHLDHLLAVDYDPAVKPGTATALFNELLEDDGGVSRYTANALEQAPSGGGGGDATESNQTTILDRLAGVMDANHTLVSAVGNFDPATDALEAIRDRGDASWTGNVTGAGDTPVNHNTGGTDNLTYVDGNGAGIEDASIRAYVKSEYDSNTFVVRGETVTAGDGTWEANLMLDAGTTYTLVFYKPGAFGPDTVDITP